MYTYNPSRGTVSATYKQSDEKRIFRTNNIIVTAKGGGVDAYKNGIHPLSILYVV